jgi:hypothetical protein
MTQRLRLVLELERDSEPIRGTLTGPGGEHRAYVGWLALIEALDQWHRAATEQESCPASPSS